MRWTVAGLALVVLVAGCGDALQPTGAASGPRAGSPASTEQTGSITGHLGYPSEFLPGQGIYAIATDGSRYFKVESVSYQAQYTMLGVRPGDYFVYAVARWGTSQSRFLAGYTKAIACGLSVDCTDHSPIHVSVVANTASTGVDVVDWYAPEGAFPLIPDGPTPGEQQSTPASFVDAQAAATSLGESRLIAKHVSTQADCRLNSACFWFGSTVGGHNASYFVAYAGSNQDLIRCALYVVRDADAWRQLDVRCTTAEAGVFPSLREVGHVQLGMGETGCVRVHSAPGLAARVVSCLKGGTRVLLDDGPYYLPTSTSQSGAPVQTDLWWHLSGSGWMVHQYLYAG